MTITRQKYLNPQNDIAFKRVFGSEKNQDILVAMLNAILKNQLCRPIREVTFLPPIQEPEILAKKQSIVDVLCRDEDGCQYIVEMQVAHTTGFEERAQYYAYKTFVQQLNQGEKYYTLKEVILLAFTNFSIFPNKKAYKSEHVTLDKKTLERNLDKISFTFVDLKKFDEQNTTTPLEQLNLEEKFYYFLRHATDIDHQHLKELVGEDNIIQKAFDEVERFHWTETELHQYAKREKIERDNQAADEYKMGKAREEGMQKGRKEGMEKGIKKGIQKGREEGMEKGIKKGRKETIERLVATGLLSQTEADKALKKLLSQ